MLKLDDNYSLDFDSYNVMLRYENKTTKDIKGQTKDITQRDLWYYPTIKLALKNYINFSLKYSESVSEVLNRIERLEKVIDNLDIPGTLYNK